MSIIHPTPYQSTVLAVPETWNLMLAGGRGGGKSTGALLLILRHVEKYGDAARPLIVRETHNAVQELEEQLDAEAWVTCPSTLIANPHLDQEDYMRRLKAACGNEEELYRAWVAGDWNIARGAFFGASLDEKVHMLPVAWPYPITKAWRPFL